MPSSALRAGNARPYECFRSSGDERRGDHWSPESLPPGEGIRCGGELADSVVRPYMMLRIRKMPSDRHHPDSVRRVVGPREVTRGGQTRSGN